MKWVTDSCGSFRIRPYYSLDELESQCDDLICGFLAKRYGRADFPVRTDDLTVLIENQVQDLDLFADLSEEGLNIDGVTEFFLNRRPQVRIDQRLSTNPRFANRLRTTLTHELGHVTFHKLLFEGPRTADLFEDTARSSTNRCGRSRILSAPRVDWMEWQAGFASGALLMPRSILNHRLRQIAEVLRLPSGRISVESPAAAKLVTAVAESFAVSREAAEVRLLQREVLVHGPGSQALFV